MSKPRILVSDDEHLISSMLALKLGMVGYALETAASGKETLQKFYDFKPDLVILDLSLPDADGLDLLVKMRASDDTLPIIVITANILTDSAVNAFKLGAVNFFGKPFDMDEIVLSVAKSLNEKKTEDAEITPIGRRNISTPDQMIGNSPKMVYISKLIFACASTDAKTVLVTGESGSGKGLVARAIHQYSARASAPFIEVNCAAIPENLIENELFGHDRGAYTDAAKKQKGIFELADGGTVFLDEIGDMPHTMQTKLLKILETKRFRRLGGEVEVETDVRIIAATNQNLTQMVSEGRFRGDLYYRLNMMNICVPALRHRLEDIPAMVQYFIERLNAEYGRRIKMASSEALEKLLAYSWPGNVRELRNAIERAMMLEKGNVLTHFHLSEESPQTYSASSPEPQASDYKAFVAEQGHRFAEFQLPPEGISLEEMEKQMIILALENASGNQSKAAKFLKMSRDTLRYRMKKFGISETMDRDSGCKLADSAQRNSKTDAYGVLKWADC
ncbi:MAG: sigma-54 dependent transcriptional regulator [Desulfuromonadaceae bacterium]|nr:sigma-54 dependent transcriptional regulator [Desulfuromonadaceae bacterium]